jgi:CRP-like cAMP-binding protein
VRVSGDPELAAAARHNHLLRGLPKDQFSAILGGCSLVQLEQHRILYREDGNVPAVYFPIDAVISILVGAGGTPGVEVATVGNEGVVGASAVLGVQRAFGKTLVHVAGQSIAVTARHAARLLCEQPEVSILLRRYLFAFMRQVAQSGACNRLHTAEERCARWLLMTRDRAGTDQFAITQDLLAAMMGARRPTVNLALSVLRNAGAIEYRYRTLKVLDREQLESFSCPCYSIIRKVFEVVRLE